MTPWFYELPKGGAPWRIADTQDNAVQHAASEAEAIVIVYAHNKTLWDSTGIGDSFVEALRAGRAPGLLKGDPPLIFLHYLSAGLPLCGFTSALPKDWPGGHRWIGVHDEIPRSDLTFMCTRCADLAGQTTKGER